jgi:hypothetical protein
LISSVSLPVAVLASAMCGIFCLRGPVLWLVSSYVGVETQCVDGTAL